MAPPWRSLYHVQSATPRPELRAGRGPLRRANTEGFRGNWGFCKENSSLFPRVSGEKVWKDFQPLAKGGAFLVPLGEVYAEQSLSGSWGL